RFKLKNLYTSNKCWRVCGLVGDHTHIFWNCPLLLAYWKNIQNEINKCLNIEFVLKEQGPLRTDLVITSKCCLSKIDAGVLSAFLQRLKRWGVYINLVCMAVTPGGASSEVCIQESPQTVC
uniref:Uncharacterized protein n=1 Tax=Astyanax mexicanus TaxID=7994 RepID=A0A8B9GTY6_ASTMX